MLNENSARNSLLHSNPITFESDQTEDKFLEGKLKMGIILHHLGSILLCHEIP